MRHKNGGSTGTTPTELLPSAESKVRIMNGEESDESKIFLIFLTACFIGITSAFLIGYMLGILGGVIFGTGFANQFFPYSTMIPWPLTAFSSLSFLQVSTSAWPLLSLPTNLCVIGPFTYALGFGLMYQGSQVYMSDMGFAHRNYLPSLNIAFKMMIAVGIFVANLVKSSTDSIGWGWKVSIGIAAIPAAITSIGSFLLPDTPMSMIKLGKFDDAKQLLQRLHGTNDGVHILFKDLLAANEASKSAKG
ncbi:sugar transport protein MST7-like [Papaver somniferum]|uniref:sugar transport protein MST7-like n=1 Tax=Papaver somniferum TaxID=3469 RepID=UPI000E702F40|nr:sugar transport protein MST7-like [Papaver somniferum]